MKYCHSCAYYSAGWCSVHNRGQAPSGSCRVWSGYAKGVKHKQSKQSKGKAKRCGSCVWYDSQECSNEKSPAYGKTRDSSACCPEYSKQTTRKTNRTGKKKTKIKPIAKAERISQPASTIVNENQPIQEPTNSHIMKKPPVGEQQRCNRCKWFRGVCCNPESDNNGRQMSRLDWCEKYERL